MTRLPHLVLLSTLLAVSCAPRKTFRPGQKPDDYTAADVEKKTMMSTLVPAAAELEKIAAAPLPPTVSSHVLDAESWTLGGPARDRFDLAARASSGGPWNALVDGVLGRSGGKGKATESAACMARELARFAAKNESKEPVPDLAEFMAVRCGVEMRDVEAGFHGGTAPEGMKEAALADQLKKELEGELAIWAAADREIGIAFAREKKTIIVASVGISRSVDLEPFTFLPGDDGIVRLRGKAHETSDRIVALINRGRFGWAECASETVLAPEFSFTCRADKGDARAWIAVARRENEHSLLYPLFSTMVFPAGKTLDDYHRPTLPAVTPSGGSGVDDLLAAVNAVRGQANLGFLHESKEQSAITGRLAGHFFGGRDAGLKAASPLEDKIGRGLTAGWSVGEPLRYGQFVSAWSPDGGDETRAVASMAERPDGRSVLFDPKASLVAIGEVKTASGQLVGGIIATYGTAVTEDEASRVTNVVTRINQVRAQQKLSPIVRILSLDPAAAEAVADLETKHIKPGRVMDHFLAATVEKAQANVHGWTLETAALDSMHIPTELATAPNVQVAIAVAWVKAPGDPWGRYVVIVAGIAGR